MRHSAPCIIFQKVKDAIRALQFQQKALLHFIGMHVKPIGCRCHFMKGRQMKTNIEKMKETLVLIADVAESLEAEMKRNHAPLNQIQDVANIRNVARDAAAFRLRNCDVGTIKEQAKNVMKGCDDTSCDECPIEKLRNQYPRIAAIQECSCEFLWSYVPCQEGETKCT